MRRIDARVPASLEIHLAVDNYASHKHPKVKAWLAGRPRYNLHDNPNHADWINQIDR